MSTDKSKNSKIKHLRKQSNLNPHPEKVTTPLFREDKFFDPLDLVQVKYEMLRKVRVDRQPVNITAAEFGFSRPTFYESKKSFECHGITGLLPKKRGPQKRHKLTDEIVNFINEILEKEGPLLSSTLVDRIKDNFNLKIHKRSIERALKAPEKKLDKYTEFRHST